MAKKNAPNKLYRVFLTRHFIAATYVEVVADSEKKARSKAKKVVENMLPDVRQRATDNHWQIEDAPVVIEHVGHHSQGGGADYMPHAMRYSNTDPDVFVQPEDLKQ